MKLVFALFLILLVLHQDNWNWGSAELMFGFLPRGLAFHAMFSVLCAVFGFIALQKIDLKD